MRIKDYQAKRIKAIINEKLEPEARAWSFGLQNDNTDADADADADAEGEGEGEGVNLTSEVPVETESSTRKLVGSVSDLYEGCGTGIVQGALDLYSQRIDETD